MYLVRKTLNHCLKKAVRFFGYDLVKRPNKANSHPNESHKGFPLKVEFIGPSGVGKSTIIKEMVLQKTKDEKWVVAGELTNRYEKSDNIACKIYDDLLKIHTEQMMSRPTTPLRKKITLLRYYLKLVSEEELINMVAGNNTVVFHEGLFHNGGSSIIELEKTHPDVFLKIIRNKAIVNCTADPETIVKYVRNRQKQGTRRSMLEGYNDRELMEKAQSALNKKKELVELLQNHQIPCLEINTTESIAQNAHKIRSFLKQISASAFND